jgi:hypothetical protein
VNDFLLSGNNVIKGNDGMKRVVIDEARDGGRRHRETLII